MLISRHLQIHKNVARDSASEVQLHLYKYIKALRGPLNPRNKTYSDACMILLLVPCMFTLVRCLLCMVPCSHWFPIHLQVNNVILDFVVFHGHFLVTVSVCVWTTFMSCSRYEKEKLTRKEKLEVNTKMQASNNCLDFDILCIPFSKIRFGI